MIYNFGIFDGLYVGKNSCNKIYQLWYTMIKRCYGPKIQESYLGVTVHTDWKYYSNFEKWYNENYIEGYYLDKDLIDSSKRMYSPETCSFVPREINNCVTESNNKGSPYPLGVCFHKKKKDMLNEYKKPYYSQLGNKSLGSFSTPEEAHRAWQHAKIIYLEKLVAKYHKDVRIEVIDGLKKRIDILKSDIANNRITETINKI